MHYAKNYSSIISPISCTCIAKLSFKIRTELSINRYKDNSVMISDSCCFDSAVAPSMKNNKNNKKMEKVGCLAND